MLQVESAETAARTSVARPGTSVPGEGDDVFGMLFASLLTSSDAARARGREVAQFWRDQQQLSEAHAAERSRVAEQEDEPDREQPSPRGEVADRRSDPHAHDAGQLRQATGPELDRIEDAGQDRPALHEPGDRVVNEASSDQHQDQASESRESTAERSLDQRMPNDGEHSAERETPVRRRTTDQSPQTATLATMTASLAANLQARSLHPGSGSGGPGMAMELAAPAGLAVPGPVGAGTAQGPAIQGLGAVQPVTPGDGFTTAAGGTHGALPQSVAAASSPSGSGSGDGGTQSGHEGARSVVANTARAAATSSGSGSDFQTLLNAAGTRREAIQGGRTDTTATLPRATDLRSVDLTQARAVQELASVVRSNMGARHSSMMLQLDPPELGRMRIDVRMHDQTLTVRFEAHSQAGHDALASRLVELRGALEQHGIQVSQMDVELRPPPAPASEGRDPQGHASQDQSGGGGDAGDAHHSDDRRGHSRTPSGPDEPGGSSFEQGQAAMERAGDMELPAESGVNLVI